MRKAQYQIVLFFQAVILILLFAVANLFGIRELWGINFLKFFPPFWTYLSLSIIAVLMIPPVSKATMSALDALSRIIIQKKAHGIVLYILSSTAFLLLFMKFHSAIPLLGDGSLRANEIYDGRMWHPTEMLDFLFHGLLYKFVFHPLGYKVTVCYRVFSAVCGVVFICGILRLAIYIKSAQFITLFLTMFSSGMTALFFGYVESYSLIAALLPFVTHTGLKVADGQSSRLSLVLWYVVAILIHSVAVFVFSCAMIVAMMLPGDEKLTKTRRISNYLALIIILSLAGAYIGRLLGVSQLSRYLLAPLAQEHYQQGIVTANHMLNLVNWLFLSGLPFLFLIATLIRKNGKEDIPSKKRIVFVMWMIIPSLLFVFFFVPQIGGPRDWDLFSLPVFILIPSILTIYFARFRRPLPYQILPLIFVSCFVTAGFVAVNNSVTKSVDRFVEVIEVGRFKNLYVEYTTLFNHSGNHPELFNRRLEFALKAWEQPPYKKADSLYLATQLAQTFLSVGDKSQALRFINLTFEVDSLDLNNYLLLHSFYERHGAKEDAILLAEKIERLFPNSARGQMECGVMFLKLGHTERGGKNLERAYQLDDSNFLILLNYGNYLLLIEDYKSSIEILTGAIELKPDDFSAHLSLAAAYLYLGKASEARAFLGTAEALKKTPREHQKLERLKELLEEME